MGGDMSEQEKPEPRLSLSDLMSIEDERLRKEEPKELDQTPETQPIESTPEPEPKEEPMSEPSCRNTAADYYKDQSKISHPRTHGPFPTTESSALDAIQARAVGGRVAVIERGAKEAKVVNMVGEEKKKKSKRHLANEIPLSESTIKTIRDLQGEINSIDLEIGRNWRSYKENMRTLTEKSKKAEESFNSAMRYILKKHGAPDGWRVDLKTMRIVPPQQITIRSGGRGR